MILKPFRLTEGVFPCIPSFLRKRPFPLFCDPGADDQPDQSGVEDRGPESRKSIIYHDEVREVLFDFIQKKVNQQYQELKGRTEMPSSGSMIQDLD